MNALAMKPSMERLKMRRLVDRLPTVRGTYTENAPLAKHTWLRVGGCAEVLFEPADTQDLLDFMADKPTCVAVTVIGVASNLLIRDGGIPGVTIRLGRAFSEIDFSDSEVRVEAGALDIEVARAALANGRRGLEFLIGVPGTIGGALRMNAGAYGSEIADIMIEAEAIDCIGGYQRISHQQMGFNYRPTAISNGWIFIAARFSAVAGEITEIKARMDEIRTKREASQPLRTRTGGSTFANPDGAKAWQLIDQAGCRGLRIGGAQVSEKHCNFLINTGTASAADIEALGEEVRRRVAADSGVDLRWEIQRVGVAADQEVQ
jgi:UDP-N-acetylmuramate dehydrogenase